MHVTQFRIVFSIKQMVFQLNLYIEDFFFFWRLNVLLVTRNILEVIEFKVQG